MSHFSEPLDKLLRKMCEYGEISYDNVNWDDGSHLHMVWTQDQEDSFKEWLTDELMRNGEFRRNIARFPSLAKAKRYARKLADEFCLNYAFRVKYDDTDN